MLPTGSFFSFWLQLSIHDNTLYKWQCGTCDFIQNCVPDRQKRRFRSQKKHVLAIENVQFIFYIVILAIQNAILGQCRSLFVYQIGCLTITANTVWIRKLQDLEESC